MTGFRYRCKGGQQFTYGVVWEGVIAEDFTQISAKFPQTYRRISAPFKQNEFSANFPQNFRKNPFANDPIGQLLKPLSLPKNPAVPKILRVVNLLPVLICYRDDPCANAIFMGFTGIFLLKEGFGA